MRMHSACRLRRAGASPECTRNCRPPPSSGPSVRHAVDETGETALSETVSVSVSEDDKASSVSLAAPTTALALLWAGAAWWAWLACRLFAFELAFDALFYVAHRGVHAVPSVYRAVHKLHHSHTHDLRLLSALQMSAADVVLTHTLPVLGALALVPLAPGLELSVAKTYLLFQELYGHAGCEHRGRCFGPAPWLTEALGIELRAADHQRHHVQGSVNFSKRFSLFDRLFGTWADGPRPRGLKVIDLAEAPADAYPVD